jgi:F0F1-type ATP synthase assembly protein I
MRDGKDSRRSSQEIWQERLNRRARTSRSIGFATMIPTMLGVGPLLGYLLGALLERRFGHAPWFGLGGVVLGGVASVRQVILLLKRSNEADDSSGQNPRSQNPDR